MNDGGRDQAADQTTTDATMLLDRIRSGDQAAANELLPLIYEELRARAGVYFRAQAVDHTLQPTALVHEAYVKLVRSGTELKSRAHFCALAATAMRQILIDHARAKLAAKRSGVKADITISGPTSPSGSSLIDLVAMDEALSALAANSERSARLVELRMFGGLSTEEIAHVLGVSTATVTREWRHTRAWLSRQLGGEEPA